MYVCISLKVFIEAQGLEAIATPKMTRFLHFCSMQKILLKAAIRSKRPDIIKLLLTMGAKVDSSILTEVIVESENEYVQ